MTDHDDDKLLDADLYADSDVSRAYRRLATEQPNEIVDARIIAAARDDLQPAGRQTRRAGRWTLPASLAATIMISATLILMVTNEQRNIWTPGETSSAVEPEADTSEAAATTAATPAVQTEVTAQPAAAVSSPPTSNPGEPMPRTVLHSLVEQTTGSAPPDTDSLDQVAVTVELLDNPPAWLSYIEALASQNQLDDARTQLRAFTHRYPDHALPATLESLR